MSVMRYDATHLWRAAIGVIGIAFLAASNVATADDSQSRRTIVALAFDASTHTFIKAEADALHRRADDGADWQALPLPDTAKQGRITAVAISSQAPHTVYLAGRGLGVLRSSDLGKTWVSKDDGLPSRDVVALTVHADQAATVYVYLAGKGIFRSEDAGDHWRLMDAGPRDAILQLVHSNMPGSMQTGWLFAATGKGVGRSMDCFCGWRDAGAVGRQVTAVAYDPREPHRVYAAATEGLFVSDNGGEQWSSVRSPGRITALIATPAGRLIAGTDAGALFQSADGGLTWRRIDG